MLPQVNPSLVILAVAGIVYLIIQFGLKRFPGVCGKYSLLLNVVLSTVGTIFTTRPQHFGDVLSLIVETVAVAAGVHGTVRSFTGKPAAQPVPQSTGSVEDGFATYRINPDTPSRPGLQPPSSLMVAMVTAGLLWPLMGCAHNIKAATPPTPLPLYAVDRTDATANEVLQTASAFAARVSADVLSRKLVLTPSQRTILEVFNKSINRATPVEVTYHQCGLARQANPALAPCDAPTLIAAINAVQAAFTSANLSLLPAPVK